MSKRAEWWLPVLAKIWPITWKSARATRWPFIGKFVELFALPFMSETNFNVTHIPINKKINGIENLYLPERIVEDLINRSSHRVVIKKCTCRDERTCEKYPVHFGCLQLGDGSREIDPRIANHLSKEDAVQHMKNCIAAGLTPMIGRVKIDNLIWGVKDLGKLLAICFCCHCCCTVFNSGKFLPDTVTERIVRLKGLSIKVDHEKCRKCQTCVQACFVGNINVLNGKIYINPDNCKGCGQCVSSCPENALSAEIDHLNDALAELNLRIKKRIHIE